MRQKNKSKRRNKENMARKKAQLAGTSQSNDDNDLTFGFDEVHADAVQEPPQRGDIDVASVDGREPWVSKLNFSNGIWHGLLGGFDALDPEIQVLHQGRSLDDVSIKPTLTSSGEYEVYVPIAGELLNEGANVFLITHTQTQNVLGQFNIICDDRFEDVRGEVELLRAELDLLKRTFRQHVRESKE